MYSDDDRDALHWLQQSDSFHGAHHHQWHQARPVACNSLMWSCFAQACACNGSVARVSANPCPTLTAMPLQGHWQPIRQAAPPSRSRSTAARRRLAPTRLWRASWQCTQRYMQCRCCCDGGTADVLTHSQPRCVPGEPHGRAGQAGADCVCRGGTHTGTIRTPVLPAHAPHQHPFNTCSFTTLLTPRQCCLLAVELAQAQPTHTFFPGTRVPRAAMYSQHTANFSRRALRPPLHLVRTIDTLLEGIS